MSNPTEHALGLPIGTILQEYEIEGVLGKGGFAITYQAKDLRLKSRVVIKELLPDGIVTRVQGSSVVTQTERQHDDFKWAIESFLKEAQTLAQFEHPNIVTVSRMFEANGTAYIVMPFIQGETIKDLIEREAPVDFYKVQIILDALLDGLSHIHQSNILHRDIKPDNIFLTESGVPILIDFGAARQQVNGKSMDVTSIITPGYAPIEQYSMDARYQGAWSDIYATAAVVYHMVTGHKPPAASDRSDALRNSQLDPIKGLSLEQNSHYPIPFLKAVDKALSMGEKQRPQTVDEWRAMLQLAPRVATPLGGVAPSIMVPEQGHSQKGTKKKSANRIIAVVLVLGCLLFLCLIGLGIYFIQTQETFKTTKSSFSASTQHSKLPASDEPSEKDLAPVTVREIKIRPKLSYQDKPLSSEYLQLFKKYLKPSQEISRWAVSVDGTDVKVTLPKETKLPLAVKLVIPHMHEVIVYLADGREPEIALEPMTRGVMIVTTSVVSEVKYIPAFENIGDLLLRDFLRSHVTPEKFIPAKGERLVKSWMIPSVHGDLLVRTPSNEWSHVIDPSARFVAVGGQKPEYMGAANRLSRLAENAYSGDASSQYQLAVYHRQQKGVDDAQELSASWQLLAATQNYADAQHDMGTAYENGHGVKRDLKKAIGWYLKAAEQNQPAAIMAVGTFYEHALGGYPKNLQKAKIYYAQSAEQGYAPAMHNLAFLNWGAAESMVDQGAAEKDPAVTKLRDEAIKLYGQAAQKGNVGAMHSLGLIYQHGLHVPADKARAIKMYEAAAAKGYEESKKILQKLADEGDQSALEALRRL